MSIRFPSIPNFFSFLILTGLLVSIDSFVLAQSDYSYKRSSLHLVLLDQSPYHASSALKEAFFSKAFPDKYDPIELQDTILNLTSHNRWRSRGTPSYACEKRISEAFIRSKGNIDAWMVDVMSPDEELARELVLEYIENRDIARKLVAEWFQRDENGTFSMDRVMDRGAYSASILDAAVAGGSVMGNNLLRDAGIELISNTFVLFTNLTLINNYMFVRKASEKVSRFTKPKSNLGRVASLRRKASHKLTRKIEDGFMIWTTGYLFRLKWNEEIENTFFSEMWISRGEKDPDRKALFESTDLFELEYVGNSYAQNLATNRLLGDDTSGEIVRRLTLRNIEACYTSLQKTYDVFKTKTPLLSVNPASAHIGMKEGLEGGERFEVLEVREDPETGIQSLHRIGVIRVDKNKIWDNRYGAEELLGSGKSETGRTWFVGTGNYKPGMLIRQIK